MVRITVFQDFQQAEPMWRKWESELTGYGFQSYDWTNGWYQTIGRKHRIRLFLIFVQDNNDIPLILLPLGLQRRWGLEVLSWLGGWVTDYHAPMVNGEWNSGLGANTFKQIWKSIIKKIPTCDVVHLRHQPEWIEEQKNPFLFFHCIHHADSYSSELQDSWEAFYKSRISTKPRSTDRRKLRRLAEHGEVKLVIASGREKLWTLVDYMIQQKVRRYEELQVPNTFADTAYRDFYHHLAERHTGDGLIQVATLMVGDTPIASHWGMIWGKRFYWLMPTFEGGAWRRYSPGRMLMIHLLQWCFEQKLEVFDYTIGAESYKKDWNTHEMRLFESVEAVSLKGIPYWVLFQIKEILKCNSFIRHHLKKMVSFLRKK